MRTKPCREIRRSHPSVGSCIHPSRREFRLGLWVGKKAYPAPVGEEDWCRDCLLSRIVVFAIAAGLIEASSNGDDGHGGRHALPPAHVCALQSAHLPRLSLLGHPFPSFSHCWSRQQQQQAFEVSCRGKQHGPAHSATEVCSECAKFRSSGGHRGAIGKYRGDFVVGVARGAHVPASHSAIAG